MKLKKILVHYAEYSLLNLILSLMPVDIHLVFLKGFSMYDAGMFFRSICQQQLKAPILNAPK
ncbi:hypothetical protein SynBIOSU31_00279 [Synechococcus sp. BIOS-U3-1]|nr:hypothetical protein SynBIOSU31_00279 [Synechococcus sp. BIOS-U3-1]